MAMSPSYTVTEHVLEGQHIREYARATAHSQEEILYLAVKQYTPKDNPRPQPGDVTIIASPANGFPKEVYEALFDDLLPLLRQRSIRIRSIWIADVAWQGASSALNERNLASWFDHARDLLHMVNCFRADMKRPIVGLGHSFGACIIAKLSLLHPRLFSGLVLLDPVISDRQDFDDGETSTKIVSLSANRRDLWPSRQAAAEACARSPYYQSWDPRVLAAWLRHGLRDTPTGLFPEPDRVTLASTRHMETFTYSRPLLESDTGKPRDGAQVTDATSPTWHRPPVPLYRPEPVLTTMALPHLRPGVLFVFGGTSPVNPPETRQALLSSTGKGVGGSGGVEAGKVRAVTLRGYGHLLPMQAPTPCAELATDLITDTVKTWLHEQVVFEAWAMKPDVEKQVLGELWERWIGPGKRQQKL